MRDKFTLDWIENWARRNPIYVIISVALVVCSSVISIVNDSAQIVNIYKSVFGKQDAKYKKIGSLTSQVNIDYFVSILGAPVFKNHIERYVENVFVDPDFYVQALTDANGKVLLYSVTTRTPNFHPEIKLGDLISNNGVVKLGTTTLSNIGDDPQKVDAQWSASSWGTYREKYYFGRPGLYQNYSFALCDSGFMSNDLNVGDLEYTQTFDWEAGVSASWLKQRKLWGELEDFRKVAPINTYSVSEPFSEVNDNVAMICPTKYHSDAPIKET